MSWFVYILQCSDKTYYTGICKDIEKRLKEHNEGDLGAKYTRVRRPVRIVYSSQFETRSLATKEELRIKKLNRAGKVRLIEAAIW